METGVGAVEWPLPGASLQPESAKIAAMTAVSKSLDVMVFEKKQDDQIGDA